MDQQYFSLTGMVKNDVKGIFKQGDIIGVKVKPFRKQRYQSSDNLSPLQILLPTTQQQGKRDTRKKCRGTFKTPPEEIQSFPTEKLIIRSPRIKQCMPQIDFSNIIQQFKTTQLLLPSMYYYYAYNLLPSSNGLLATPVLSPCSLAYFDPCSLHYAPEDSFLQAKLERPKKEPIVQPTSPSLHSQSSHTNHHQKEAWKRRSTPEEDGSDAFTEKRNIIPNNINHILAFVQRRSKSERVITRAIQRLAGPKNDNKPCDFNTRRFYAYQSYLKGKIDIHVSKKTLALVAGNLDLHSDIFSPEEQLFYNRVCRAAIAHYLRNVAALTTLNSRRLRETSKKDHLRAQRHLLHFMKNIENQQMLQA